MKRVSRIAIKFSGIVSALILIIMLMMASLILKQTKDSLIKEMQIRAEFFARDVRESLFPKPDAFNLYFAAQEMAKEKAILYAMVVGSDGKILAHNDKIKIGEKLSDQFWDILKYNNQTVISEEQGFYDIGVPIIVGEIKVGAIRIGFSHQSIKNALTEMKNKIILITVSVLLISIFVTIIVVAVMVKPINTLAALAKKIGEGDLNHQIETKSNDEIGDLGKNFNEMINGLKDRNFIRNTFGRYVSSSVAEAILSGRLKLGGERKKATVLFSDIRNFTSMSEKLPPEDIVEFLNEYFTEMVSIITKYEGVLDKFIGDAVLAVFGVPISQPGDAHRALFAALEMQERLKIFNETRSKAGKNNINIGIGINTGELVAGNIGSEVRMEYTVIGDTVNVSERIEELNKEFGTKILISENTYKEIKDEVEVREIQSVSIRGKERKITVYEVLRKRIK
ncbi:MAG: adenylate/guanylate cyclase domain-containing protein [Elusimicrobiota bacterium]|nr:adenylate/guanylate cyclase domain-containing protein [Elusimicrobiota bacterium]